jgi:type VI secretion system protein ImpC
MRRDTVTTHLDVSPGQKRQLTPVDPDTPFRMVLVANFSAGQHRARKSIRVDFDNFEEVLARLHPQLELPGPDGPIRVRFESMDDFLPDALYHNLPLFQELQEMGELQQSPRPAPARRPTPEVPESALSSGGLLDDIISGIEKPARRDAWEQTIDDVVSPYIQPTPSRQEGERAQQIEEAAQLAMRMILHHPEFQELEANWRAVDFLLRRLEIGAEVQLHLIDLSKAELQADPVMLGRLLQNDEPWAIIAGLYTFETHPDQIQALSALAKVAAEAGAPFVSSISPAILGCASFASTPDPDDWTEPIPPEAEEAWINLRRQPEAEWLGLILPRFLLRHPYTKESVESFRFEEMTNPPESAEFLWANPATAAAYLLAESFQQDGWNIALRNTQITGLPLHTYERDGETEMTPCAECWMSERAAEKFLDRGIMPLGSMKHKDAARLIRLQSIANPAAPLAGRWRWPR